MTPAVERIFAANEPVFRAAIAAASLGNPFAGWDCDSPDFATRVIDGQAVWLTRDVHKSWDGYQPDEVIYSYPLAQALEDGTLIALAHAGAQGGRMCQWCGRPHNGSCSVFTFLTPDDD
jgi:hypothetical protein